MSEWVDKIGARLLPFKQKHYLNLLVRGFLLTTAVLVSYFLIAAAGEYLLWFDSWVRFLLLSLFLALSVFCFYRYLLQPARWFLGKRGMQDDEAARRIGQAMTGVEDQLINMIQLARTNGGDLAEASLRQKFRTLEPLAFESSIDLRLNRKYLPYAVLPIIITLALLGWNKSILTGSTQRIVRFNETFSPTAPFSFDVLNESLDGHFGEDFLLSARLSGDALPDELFIEQNGLRHKMLGDAKEANRFSYVFEKIQADQLFRFYAAGYYSQPFTIHALLRPELTGLMIRLDFPAYLGMRNQEIANNGNIEIPAGTRVQWSVSSSHTEKAFLAFGDNSPKEMENIGNEEFRFSQGFFEDQPYTISLVHGKERNKDRMEYNIRVIPDAFPVIQARQAGDSLFFQNVYLGGNISDDHGLTALALKWQKVSEQKPSDVFNSFAIPISIGQLSQNFMVPWSIDSLKLEPGDQLNYYLEVWDNDGVRGRKSSRTGLFTFHVPKQQELDNRVRQSEQETAEDIQRGMEKAKSLSEAIEEAQKKLRGKQSMDWQDKAMIEDILRQKQEMEKALEEIREQNEQLNKQRSTFDEQDERIREKTEQLQQLMEELLDDETKKLFQQLEKLLKENANPEQMQKMLDKIERNEINLEKELDRIKELFKQLQLDAKIDQGINRLDETIQKQEKLLKETQEKDAKGDRENKENNNGSEKQPEELAREQENIRQDLEDTKEDMKELEKLGEEAGEDLNLPEEEKLNEAGEEMKNSEESLKQGNEKKAGEAQKKAIEQMKQMRNQLANMQNSMEMEMDEANLESLRQILHGMLKLSFDQESTMKTFLATQASDPSYLSLAQHQIKLQDDAKVLEDSLLALSKKDMMMNSFVTREIGELNHHLERTSEHIRERRKANAGAEMQLSMTSMNNLALMLNDHFQQMMEMMAKPGKGKGKKKGKKPGLAEMQKKLNEQIEQLKNGGKSGRELSEELARMAAEQERIRKALQNLQQQLGEEGKKLGGDLPGKMEQTEIDLVNKRLTEQTIRRQKEILTRLLEAERSMREQEFDQERKGETAKDYEKEIPKAFEEYLKLKEREAELLKTIPPRLLPYYRREVDSYFERLGRPKPDQN